MREATTAVLTHSNALTQGFHRWPAALLPVVFFKGRFTARWRPHAGFRRQPPQHHLFTPLTEREREREREIERRKREGRGRKRERRKTVKKEEREGDRRQKDGNKLFIGSAVGLHLKVVS